MSVLEQMYELENAGKRVEANRLMAAEMQKLAIKLGAIASQYPKVDLPLVVATLRACAQGLENIIGPVGREVAQNMAKMVNVTGVEVDAAELKRQMEGMEYDG